MCVCQVTFEGTGSPIQAVHSDTGDQCTDFTSTSADIPARVDDANLEGLSGRHEQLTHACRQCGSEFNAISHLWCHVKAEHNNSDFSCPQCPCTYASKCGLTKHVNLIHEKLSRCRCDTCGKGVMDRSRYLDHIATHAGVKRHVCPICCMDFTYKSSLKGHVLRAHPNDDAAEL